MARSNGIGFHIDKAGFCCCRTAVDSQYIRFTFKDLALLQIKVGDLICVLMKGLVAFELYSVLFCKLFQNRQGTSQIFRQK